MKPDIQADKIVILSGSGISAESGLPTFRSSGGLWRSHSWEDLASPQGWRDDPARVLEFYDERRLQAWNAAPNAAHVAIAALEASYEVVVVTQNVDELHERAGSTNVIHVHGRIDVARGTSDARHRRRLEGRPLALGDLCEDGTQLRPDVVWFGEDVEHLDESRAHVACAAKVLVVGTSLTVFPVASLVKAARGRAEKVLVALDIARPPWGYDLRIGKATEQVPALVERWLAQAR